MTSAWFVKSGAQDQSENEQAGKGGQKSEKTDWKQDEKCNLVKRRNQQKERKAKEGEKGYENLKKLTRRRSDNL